MDSSKRLRKLRLMRDIRESIVNDKFPEFVKAFMQQYYGSEPVPEWITTALARVNIQLLLDEQPTFQVI